MIPIKMTLWTKFNNDPLAYIPWSFCMPLIDLNEIDIETILYSLNIAKSDLKESLADPNQSSEDKSEWQEYITEIDDVTSKINGVRKVA